MAHVLFTFVVLTTLLPFYAKSEIHPEVIYGDDTRLDLYEISENNSLYNTLAKSTAVIASISKIRDSILPGLKKIKTKTLHEAQNVCHHEPFSQQPTVGFCSSFLVAEDLMVTAGHCMNTESQCSNAAFIFDYSYQSGNEDLEYVKSANIYYCQEILDFKYGGKKGTDYALIKLNRPVLDRQPLEIRTHGKVSDHEELSVIGHPMGLPTKVVTGAEIRDNSKKSYFVTNSDTFSGNSGSPVFNKDGIVEGLLVRGEKDYRYDNSCKVSFVCKDNDCRGEDAIRTTEFSDTLLNLEKQI